MDRTITIIGYQWRAYWRRLGRGGKASAANQGITLLLFALVFFKYLQWLRLAAGQLAQGKTALLEALLGGLFLAWLFPLAGGPGPGIATRRWLHLPLSLKELFRLRMISLLMPPAAWIVVAASLLICYPLGQAERPLMGITAALLFIGAAALFGLTISHLITIALCRRVFLAIALALLGGAGLYASSGAGANSLRRLTSVLPADLVTRAALGQRSWMPIVILATACVVTYQAAFWSFRFSLENASHNSARSLAPASLNFPGRLGGLLSKDCRYFRRLLDVYLGLLATAAGCVYLATAELPSRGIFLAFISIVFLCGAAVSFNSFGLDRRAGLDRYSLLPLSGQSIVLSKNLAFLIIVSAQVLPLILLAGWRMGISTAAYGLLATASMACAYTAWGNWMSVSHPLKMNFFHFSSTGAALADALAGAVFGSLPGILIIYLLQAQGDGARWKIALVVLLPAALYRLSLSRFGKRFEQKREAIARVLS